MNHTLNLQTLLANLMKHSKIFSEEKQYDIEIIKQRYDFYKNQIELPLKNQHYTNCIWSEDQLHQHVSMNDFCSCYYIQRFPKQLCNEIIDKFGLEYMMKC